MGRGNAWALWGLHRRFRTFEDLVSATCLRHANAGLMLGSLLQRGSARAQWELDQGFRKFEDLASALERNASAQAKVRPFTHSPALSALFRYQ